MGAGTFALRLLCVGVIALVGAVALFYVAGWAIEKAQQIEDWWKVCARRRALRRHRARCCACRRADALAHDLARMEQVGR